MASTEACPWGMRFRIGLPHLWQSMFEKLPIVKFRTGELSDFVRSPAIASSRWRSLPISCGFPSSSWPMVGVWSTEPTAW